MKSGIDRRLWYVIYVKRTADDPEGKLARGVCYRSFKDEWFWDKKSSTAFIDEMKLVIKSAQDAMMLRMSISEHRFFAPRYVEGYEDHTTSPSSIFENGVFRYMTEQERRASWARFEKDLWDGVDEQDDWAQYCHETKDK